MSRRYTIVLADRQSGVTRRWTIRLRPFIVTTLGVLVTPVLIGWVLRLSAASEAHHLRTANATLQQENLSYREATGSLTAQIESLQSAISELGDRARIDPVTARAMDQLPSQIKNQGGTSMEGASALLTPEVSSSPDTTFGMLKGVLSSLEGHLNIVRRTMEKREALLNATPSIWPVHGWLSAGFGVRPDP